MLMPLSGCLGLSVCYDLRFPEMYVSLVEMGATTILVPSAFTVPTGTAHWHTLLRARAIETQCYVIAAAQYGRHNEKRESYGHSLVVDPWGTVVADAGGVDSTNGGVPVPTTPSIVTCEVNSGRIDEIRQRMPIQEHRKSASSGMTVPK
jgi:deaminated glutathione amidase